MAIIQSGLNDGEQNEAALDGFSQSAPIIARYAEIEDIYLNMSLTSVDNAFRGSLETLYISILRYHVAVGVHCMRLIAIRFVRNTSKLDARAANLQRIKDNDQACRSFTTIFGFHDPRLAHSNVLDMKQAVDDHMRTCVDTTKSIAAENKREQILRTLAWMSIAEPGLDHQTMLVDRRMGSDYAESCSWLRKLPEFAE